MMARALLTHPTTLDARTLQRAPRHVVHGAHEDDGGGEDRDVDGERHYGQVPGARADSREDDGVRVGREDSIPRPYLQTCVRAYMMPYHAKPRQPSRPRPLPTHLKVFLRTASVQSTAHMPV